MKATEQEMEEARSLLAEAVSLNNQLAEELHLRQHDPVWAQEIQDRVVKIELRLIPLLAKVRQGKT